MSRRLSLTGWRVVPLLLLWGSSLPAAEIPDYRVSKIATHTYVIHGPLALPSKANGGFMNNPGFVVTRRGVVVIDPGSSVQTGRMVLRQIKKVTNKPVSHVFNTHIHGDHWLGNQAIVEAYPKVRIYAHPKMIQQAKAGGDKRWVQAMSRMTEGASDGTRAVIPQQAIGDKGKVSVGGMTFRILAPPRAHSDTDIMILVMQEQVLFLGDNVLANRLPRMDDATFRGSIAACDRALRAGAKHFVPGHGPSGDVALVKQYRFYLDTLYKEVGKLYEAGLSDFEMKPKILPRLAAFRKWSDFELQVGKHISLAVLEQEQAQFE